MLLSCFEAARVVRDGYPFSEGCPLATGERLRPRRHVITRDQYDAVLLDLDGVITDTANLHAACWKQAFDECLQKRARQRREKNFSL